MTTNPAEVTLTSPGSATAQRVIAGLALSATVAGMAVLAFSGEPWWAILLWELGLLVVVFIMLALWFSAADSAKETVALQAVGTTVLAEVFDKTVFEDSDEVYYELTFWVPLPDGGFQAKHRCSRTSCSVQEPGGRLTVLVDPKLHTWGIVH